MSGRVLTDEEKRQIIQRIVGKGKEQMRIALQTGFDPEGGELPERAWENGCKHEYDRLCDEWDARGHPNWDEGNRVFWTVYEAWDNKAWEWWYCEVENYTQKKMSHRTAAAIARGNKEVASYWVCFLAFALPPAVYVLYDGGTLIAALLAAIGLGGLGIVVAIVINTLSSDTRQPSEHRDYRSPGEWWEDDFDDGGDCGGQ